MENQKELILQFINFKVDKVISELKMDIEKAFQRDFYLKPEDVEPLISKVFTGEEKSGGQSGNIDALHNLNLVLKQSTNQKELIEGFFASLSELTNYIGFFIFKGDYSICYAAKGSGNRPQKDFKIKKIIFMEPKKLSDPIFPEELKSLLNQEKTIAIPLFIKYKQAGFFVFELKESGNEKLFEVATSMFERELNLLPLKTHGEMKTQQFKTMEKKQESAKPAASGEEDPLLKKARRYANALASDIKLYNEDKIKQGLVKGHLRELLKEDIEKSYQAFREKYPDKQRFPDSIFNDALVKFVAKGNPDLLK